jgi:hypothetical protein
LNWKGHLAQFLTFTVAPAAGLLAAWIGLRHPAVGRLGARAFRRVTAGLWLLTRVGTFLVVFPLMGYAGGYDLTEVWTPIARAVLTGADPTPFVDNLYGPLFPHVLALGLSAGAGRYAPAIDLPFLVADALSVLLLRIARRHLPEESARRVALFYLLCPVLWHGLVVRTQEEPLFVLFLLATFDLLDRRHLLSGCAVAALGTLFTKALFPLWVLPVLLAPGGGLRRCLGRVLLAGGLTVGGLLAAMAAGWDAAARLHPTLGVRGSSSWLLLFGESPSRQVFLAGLALTAIGCIAAAAAALTVRPGEGPADRAARGTVTVQAAFFLLSPFALPPHLVHALPFLAWQAVREGAGRRAATAGALLYAATLCLWQYPALRVNSEIWSGLPMMIALFLLWNAWSGARALRVRWSPT